jgi:hypothetical protein
VVRAGRASTKTKAAVAALALAAAALASTAQAGTKVYSPIVERGEFGIESRGDHTFDDDDTQDDAQTQIHEIEYGVTDRWQTALFGELKRPAGGALDYTGTAWENIFQLFEQGEPLIDSGIYLEYKRADDGDKPDKIESKILLEKELGRSIATVNFTFEREIGDNREPGTGFEYAARAKWRFRPYLEPSIEAFGELGAIGDFKPGREQEHRIGPVLIGTLPLAPTIAFYYELGWLFGLTGATPSGTLKWLAELEFYF